MGFAVAADYDRFMGRFAVPLVGLLGAPAVAAVDPAPEPVAAVARRFPDVDARVAAAEFLPHDDESFDLSVAQLVVHFMADPVAGLRCAG